ncbi:MAG: capsid cement protein [Cypionkella sp.]
MKTYIQNGHMVRVTAPVGGIISGDCIIVGSIFGVAAFSSVENDPVEIAVAQSV